MINSNGKILSSPEAAISVNNRGFTYGDAVFETIRVINGKIIFWEDHYFRFMSSLRIMRMEIPSNFSPEFLEQEILNLVEANELHSAPARVRFNVYRKEGGLYTPNILEIGYVITAQALPHAFYQENQGLYEVELFKDHFVNTGLLSTIKTNNRAVNILGSIYAKENGYQNCLLINEHKNVVGALNGNLFLVKDGYLKTPPLSEGCLKGITRQKVMEIAGKLEGAELVEEPISPFELQKADELFITNVVVGVQPVSRYRKKVYSSEVAKQILSKLNVRAKLG